MNVKPAKITPSNLKPKKQMSPLAIIILASVFGLFGGWIGSSLTTNYSMQNSSNEVRQQIVSSEAEVIAEVAQQVGQSVVSIDVTAVTTAQDLFGFQRQFESQGAGTGVIISIEGVIVTNRHVVPVGTSEVKVTLNDGTVLDAKVLARDPRNDIAFLKIEDKKGKDLTAAKLGDSSTMRVGEKVIAIGNALGQFQNTVTSGIISGYGRNISAGGGRGGSEDLTNLIQTDAAINQGNSGGPLVNLSGEVIGINTAITGNSVGQSLGFAIPVNDIKAQITSVLERGIIERPFLGVRYRAIDERFAFVYSLPVNRGAYLPPSEDGTSPILSGSPADKAGLKEKDIITKVDEIEIDERNDLVAVLGTKRVGQEVSLTILRDGQELSIDVKLEATPEE